MLMIMVALLALAAFAGVGFVFTGGDGSQARTLKRVAAIGAQAKTEKVRRTSQDVAATRRKQILTNLKNEDRAQRKQSLTLEARIRQAGLNISVRTFWIACLVLALVVLVPGFLFSHSPLIAFGMSFAAGLGLPRWVLSSLSKRRIKKFTGEFPNATDIIVRGIKSGLPVNDCLKVIARESPPPLNDEFNRVVESMGMGQTTDQAMEKMYSRMPTAEVRFFAIVLSIQSKTGGNLAEALNNLSVVLRARKLMGEKIKALSGEAVASAFIIGSLPPGIMTLVMLTTPHYMDPMWLDPRGHHMLIGGAIWMGIGILVMRKMINFKY